MRERLFDYIDIDIIYLYIIYRERDCLSVYPSRGIFLYEKLVHMIIEAEKSHGLPSASLRLGKAGGVVQPKPKGLRTREVNGENLSPRAGGN